MSNLRRKLFKNYRHLRQVNAINNAIHKKIESRGDQKGELIIQVDDEIISIPAVLTSQVEDDDSENMYMNFRPIENMNTNSSNDNILPIDLDLEADNNEENEIEIPIGELLGDIQVHNDFELQEHTVDGDGNDILQLLVKDNYDTSKNNKSRSSEKDEDDMESEECYYSFLASTANQIDDYKVRLQLRKEITSLVMSSVKRYVETKEPPNKKKR